MMVGRIEKEDHSLIFLLIVQVILLFS